MLRTLTAGTIALAMLHTSVQTVQASAWTLERGELRGSLAYSYADMDDMWDGDGSRVSGTIDRVIQDLAILMEYGAADFVTLYASAHMQRVEDFALTETGLGYADLGLRVRVFNRGGHVLSLQGEITLPGDIDSVPSVLLNQGEVEAELRALYGYSFDVAGMPAYVDVQGGYRWRNGGPANELHLDATLGWQPDPDFEALLQSINTWADGEGDAGYDYFRQNKVQGSLVFHATENVSIQAGGFWTWEGQNVEAEEGFFATAWYSF